MKIPLGRTTSDTNKDIEIINRYNELSSDVEDLKKRVHNLEKQVYCDGNLPHGMPMPSKSIVLKMKRIRFKDSTTIIDCCYKCPLYVDGYPSCRGGCWMNVNDAIIPSNCPLEDIEVKHNG
ncbi:MAG TPA: hypothetical protein O0X01_06635 [Methanocorpusculum sp.]|jgi:hypothetical protein|nr:hypothetical protein [Methanocorpusculum sp.]